jgi:hypothetical protein
MQKECFKWVSNMVIWTGVSFPPSPLYSQGEGNNYAKKRSLQQHSISWERRLGIAEFGKKAQS